MAVRKTSRNPHGLTQKQKLVVEIMADNVANKRGLRQTEAHAQVYNTNNDKTASVVASENLAKPNIREALIDSLTKKGILGVNGKAENRLVEGLDAYTSTPTGKRVKDYSTRLRYVQELHKITGVYAPQKVERSNKNINVNFGNTNEIKKALAQLKEEIVEAEVV